MHHIDQEIDRFQLSMMDLESMVDQNSPLVRKIEDSTKSIQFAFQINFVNHTKGFVRQPLY